MFCKYCNNIIEEDSTFCKYCGAKIESKIDIALDEIENEKAIQISYQFIKKLDNADSLERFSMGEIVEETRKLQTEVLRELLNVKISEKYSDDRWKMDFYSRLYMDENRSDTARNAWNTIRLKGTAYSTDDMDVTLLKSILLNDGNKQYIVWINRKEEELVKRIRKINIDRTYYGHSTYRESNSEEVIRIMRSVGNILLLLDLLSSKEYYGYGANKYQDKLIRQKSFAYNILKKLKNCDGNSFSSFNVSLSEAKLNEAKNNIDKAETIEEFAEIKNALEELSESIDVSDLLNQCNERIKGFENDAMLEAAMADMSKKTKVGYKDALNKLSSIPDWKESQELIKECNKYLKIRKVFAFSIAIISVIAVIALVIVIIISNENRKKYNQYNDDYVKAMDYLEDNNYEEALAIFKQLDGYKESNSYIDQLNEIIYKDSINLYESGQYSEALTKFSTLEGYEGSADYIIRIKDNLYSEAMNLFESNDFYAAIQAFIELAGYKDSDNYINRSKELLYEEAITYFDQNEGEAAYEIFDYLAEYKESKEYINKILTNKYNYGIWLLDEGSYDEAYQVFSELGSFGDSEIQKNEVNYRKGLAFIDAKNFDQAEKMFQELGSYSDSEEKLKEIPLLRIKFVSYLEIGETFSMGNYGNKRIGWIILDKNEDRVLAISTSVLFKKGMM